MILNNPPWLSQTPDMLLRPDIAIKHCEKYCDTNYDLLYDQGKWHDRDIYILPVSSTMTSTLSDLSDDHVFKIPQDIIDLHHSGKCDIVWDMSFEMYNPEVMSWLRHQKKEPWAHRSQDFIRNTSEHYDLIPEHTMLALNNNDWQNTQLHEKLYRPITINKCESWYYHTQDQDYTEACLTRYRKGMGDECLLETNSEHTTKNLICTLGELRQHKTKLAQKIHHSPDNWFVSAKTNIWDKNLNQQFKLPWILDQYCDPKPWDHYRRITPEIRSYMLRSAVDVVCDSIMISSPLTPDYQTTEKPFRSIVLTKPFIYLGAYQGLKYLQDLGFKTFSDYWDESYDDISDPDRRYQTVIHEINQLLSEKKLFSKLQGIQEILIHNYEHYKTLCTNKFHLRFLNDTP